MTDIEAFAPNLPAVHVDHVSPWEMLVRQADVLANSSIVPRQYQGKPQDIIAAGLMGHEVGWGVMTSLQLIHVVEGKPEVSAEGMVALIRRAGHSLKGTVSPEGAQVYGRRGDNGDEMEYSFTQEDAKRADLAGKQNWRRYPSSMLWARAVSQLGRMLFPDVLLGVSYVHGEISGADFELGEPMVPPPVDVTDITGQPAAITGPEVYVTDEEVAELLELVRKLDDESKAALKAEALTRNKPGRYSWSFAAEHQWTAKEMDDAKAWIYARAGMEPWDEETPAPVSVDEIVVEPAEPEDAGVGPVVDQWTYDSVLAEAIAAGLITRGAKDKTRATLHGIINEALSEQVPLIDDAIASHGAEIIAYIRAQQNGGAN